MADEISKNNAIKSEITCLEKKKKKKKKNMKKTQKKKKKLKLCS